MTETQKRIKAYKAALPGLRERVVAVALLLVMSLAMITSASFAWLTISRRPEVSGVNTTVAANGSLEIALVPADGSEPAASKVGDSSANENQFVTAANLTWGNLINLSDESYGLENLTLRPAQLNTASLLDSPLYGAVYGSDGRITQLTSNFGYTIWNLPEGDKPGYFGVSDSYGVRAISSTKIEAVGAEAQYYNMVAAARDKNIAAAALYTALGNNNEYMPSLATMMGLYMTARMNPSHATLSNPTCDVEDIENLRDMYAAFLSAFDAEADAMAALVNLQLFLLHGEGNYDPYTAEMIYGTTSAQLKSEGVQISNLEQFIKDRNTIASDLTKLQEISVAGGTLTWTDSGLNNIVNNLVNVGACTIGADNTPISNIGASNAMGYLSGTQEARITNGILYRFEERTGGYIEVKELGISATVSRTMGGIPITVPATVKANISTTASRDYNLFTNDLTYAEGLNDGEYEGGIPVAEDTYGLAVDLWVRTNSEGSYLTLEGNILTETREINPTGKNADNEDVYLYTLTVTGTDENGESVSYTMDVYPGTGENGETVWYDATSHMALTEEQLNGSTPVQKIEEIQYVIGYEGENRVWDEKQLSVDATTQGSGSCYVYYADTPEDQARSLILLEAFNVAFVDEDGKLLATATMDTERFYADNGRVIVPLMLSPGNSINLGEDYEGNITYAITALEKNVATRITAIVYLDGTKLTNDEVLAAADIQGQLNIQFGSSEALTPIDNEELENKERRVSASVDKAHYDFDEYSGDMITNVTVNVDGDEPSTVTAFFIRAINDSQGSREQTMTFTKDASGNWVSSYKFTVPGIYKLRTVQLDGIDYMLESPPTVTIEGFAIDTLTCTEADENRHVNILTAANSSTVNLSLKFATDDPAKMPSTVQGRFLREEDGSAVNVNFTYNSTTSMWSGTATFLSSGEYTMQYVLLNGEYMELAEEFRQTASVTLGMRVAVYTTSPHTFKYVPSEMADNEKMLAMQVKIMDNAGKEMPGLSGVKLTYGMKGSGIKTLDTDMTWDGSYYVGELTTTGPGIWQFSNVVVGSNTLTNATTYPTFTIQSPEPPAYYAHSTVASQYKPNNDAVMNAQITNSAAATVQAYIVKAGEKNGTWVAGAIGGEFTTADGTSVNNWSFKVPTDANGYQDGNWTLTQLKLWDVFAADGSAYTEESPLIIDVADTNNVTKVISRVYATFTQDLSKDFGKDASDNVTAQFMDSHTISGLNVDIKDFEGQPVDNVTDVKLTFIYKNQSSEDYGGYSSDGLTNGTAGASVTVALDQNSGTNYTQSQDQTILYAGEYITTLSFKVSGTTYTYTGNEDNSANNTKALPVKAPVFTVWSKAPTVTITARSNYGNSSNSGTSATVYFNTSTESVCGATYYNYSQPYVTMTLTGFGNASGATLTFTQSAGGTVHLYASNGGSTATNTYTWTGNGTCQRWVGYWRSSTGSDTKTAAGTLTATTLVLSYGGNSYEIDITDITISNPD